MFKLSVKSDKHAWQNGQHDLPDANPPLMVSDHFLNLVEWDVLALNQTDHLCVGQHCWTLKKKKTHLTSSTLQHRLLTTWPKRQSGHTLLTHNTLYNAHVLQTVQNCTGINGSAPAYLLTESFFLLRPFCFSQYWEIQFFKAIESCFI